MILSPSLHLIWLHGFNSSSFFFQPFLDSSSFSLCILFDFFFFLQLQPRMTPIQREQEMMSTPRLSGCNQLWLVAGASFWEEHIKILLLCVRVGEMGWDRGNYILRSNLLPTLGEVHPNHHSSRSPSKRPVSEHSALPQQLFGLTAPFSLWRNQGPNFCSKRDVLLVVEVIKLKWFCSICQVARNTSQ